MVPLKRILIRILAILLTLSPAFILGYAVYTGIQEHFDSPEYKARYLAAKQKELEETQQKLKFAQQGLDDNGLSPEFYQQVIHAQKARIETLQTGRPYQEDFPSSDPSAWEFYEFFDENTGKLVPIELPPLTGWQSWQTWFLVGFILVTIVNVNLAISFMVASVLLALALAGLGVEMGMWFGTLVMGPILILFTIGALAGGEGSKQ